MSTATIARSESSKATFNLSQKLLPDVDKFAKGKRPKIYRLVGIHDRPIDKLNYSFGTEEHVKPINPSYILDTNETVFDQFEEDPHKMNKIIRNVVGVSQKTDKEGKPYSEERVESVEFIGGYKIVMPHEIGTFLYMECHPRNKSNKYRDVNRTPVFESVEEEEVLSVLDKLERETMKGDAYGIITKAGGSGRRAIAEAMKIQNWESKDLETLTMELYEQADKDPKTFIMNSFSDESKAKVQIRDARKLEIIECFATNKMWRFTDDDKEEICEYKEDDIPEEALHKFLISTKGRKSYEKMIEKTRRLL